jgi:ABC-type lipoprotein release transport system permease subunit
MMHMAVSNLTLISVGSVVAFLGFMAALAVVGRVPLKYSIRNLIVRWPVTLLMAAAFTLVVALLTVMLAFVNGMYRLTEGSSQPGNVMVLSDGATDELFSNLGNGSDVKAIESLPSIVRDENNKPLASWEVYIVVNQEIENAQKVGRKRRFVQVRGVDDGVIAAKVHNMPLHEGGQWFSPAGSEDSSGNMVDDKAKQPLKISAALSCVVGPGITQAKLKEDRSPSGGGSMIQAVLGEGIARELGKDKGKPSLEIGDTFSLGPRVWIVKGIMQSAGSTFDSEVWAKRSLVGIWFGKENASTLVLRTENATAAHEMAEDLTKNYKKSAVQAQVESDYYDKLNATNLQFLLTIVIVTIIIAVGGVFGVMNTMFAAISQRTKDIGVLRIIGFTGWQVLVSFFLEALFLALVGGLLGCAIGSLSNGLTATSIVGSGGGGGKSVVLKLIVDMKILAAGMIISLAMGTIGGLIPALFAMRVRPLESLR